MWWCWKDRRRCRCPGGWRTDRRRRRRRAVLQQQQPEDPLPHGLQQ